MAVKKRVVKKARAKKRPAKSSKAYVSRPSQATGKAPSSRLKKRRMKAKSAPKGYFPNPVKKPIPKKIYTIFGKYTGNAGYWTGRKSLTTELSEAAHFGTKKVAEEMKKALKDEFPLVKWEVQTHTIYYG